jgi:hypothetical protein
MRTSLRVMLCVILTGPFCWAQADREKFRAEFYNPSVITPLKIDSDRFASLSPTFRTDLLSARTALIEFFASIEKPGGNSQTYLAPALSAKYKNIPKLVNKLLGQETSVSSIGISDFALEGDGIQLDFYVVLFAEGTTLARDSSAKLQKIGGAWRIASIKGLP